MPLRKLQSKLEDEVLKEGVGSGNIKEGMEWRSTVSWRRQGG